MKWKLIPIAALKAGNVYCGKRQQIDYEMHKKVTRVVYDQDIVVVFKKYRDGDSADTSFSGVATPSYYRLTETVYILVDKKYPQRR